MIGLQKNLSDVKIASMENHAKTDMDKTRSCAQILKLVNIAYVSILIGFALTAKYKHKKEREALTSPRLVYRPCAFPRIL